jgi:hypothetical protein
VASGRTTEKWNGFGRVGSHSLTFTEWYVRRLITDSRISYRKLGAAVRFDRRDVNQHIWEGPPSRRMRGYDASVGLSDVFS